MRCSTHDGKTVRVLSVCGCALLVAAAVVLLRRDVGSGPSSHDRSNPGATAAAIPDSTVPLLTVRDADGRPLEGVAVVHYAAKRILSETKTDAAGTFAFASWNDADSFAIGLEGYESRLETTRRQKSIDVRLEKSVTFRGRAVFEDGRPAADFVLELEPAFLDVSIGSLGAAVERLLAFDNTTRRRVRTDHEGRFSVTGRSDGGHVYFQRYGGWAVVNGDDHNPGMFTPTADAPELRVVIAQVPEVHGRAIDAATGAPLAGAMILVHWNGSSRDFTSAAADGGFSLTAPRKAVKSAIVEVRCQQTQISKEITDIRPGPNSLDEFALTGLVADRVVPISVHSEDGKPLNGALLRIDGGYTNNVAPSDRHGEMHARAHEIVRAALTIECPGFQSFKTTLGDDVPERIIARLEAANEAVITIVGGDGKPVSNRRLRVHLADGIKFEDFDAHRRSQPECTLPGTWRMEDSTKDGWSLVMFTMGPDPVRLWSLHPSLTYEIEVFGSMGTPTVTSVSFRLGEREKKVITLVDVLPRRDRIGRVRFSDGAPAAGAVLSFVAANAPFPGLSYATVDDDGVVRVKDVDFVERDLKVWGDGVEKKAIRPFRFPDDASPFEIIVNRTYSVAVNIADELGRRVQADAETTIGETTISAERGRSGESNFPALPDGATEIVATVAGRRFTQTIDPKLGKVAFTIPATGAVDLELPEVENRESNRFRVVVDDATTADAKPWFVEFRRLHAFMETLRIDSVFPGKWRLRVEESNWMDTPQSWTPWGQATEVTVVVGETTAASARTR